MRITTVKYAKTFNLGNFESEKIEMEAALDGEEDTPEGTLETLRKLVCGQAEVGSPATTESLPQANLNLYPIKNAAGVIVSTFELKNDWLAKFDEAIGLTSDPRAFVTHNEDVLKQIKAEAEIAAAENSNRRGLEKVLAIESRVGSFLGG